MDGKAEMNIKKFQKRTAYGADKENKNNNFDLLNSKYCKVHQTIIAGDSITELFNMELFDEYTEKTGLRVYNRGISGDTSDRFLERFSSNILALKPSNLVLLIGTNDLSLKADVSYVFENIRKIVEMTKNELPDTKIILQSVYPVDFLNKSKNRKIVELNAKLKVFALKESLIYLDIYSLLLDKKGGFNKEYTYDGLHPNAKGFEIAASQIIENL